MTDRNQIDRNPDDFEANSALIESYLAELHTAGPGVIEKVNLTDGGKIKSVDVSLVHQSVYEGEDGADDLVIDQPVITNCPVAFPRGGGFAFTFPLAKGDPVLVVFAQRSLDAYLETDGKTKHDCGDDRKHNISDAIVIPGLYTFKAPIATAHADNVVLAREDDSVHLQITPAGEIQAKCDAFRIGTDAAAVPVARGDRTDARLSALESWANTHVHAGVTTGPGSSAVAAPPLTPGAGGQATSSTRAFVDA